MSCVTGKLELNVDNDNVVFWGPVTDSAGEFIDDTVTTVSMTLYYGTPLDVDHEVAAASTGVSMTYVDDSNARFKGILPSTVPLTAGYEYTLVITATVSGDSDTRIEVPCIAITRTN